MVQARGLSSVRMGDVELFDSGQPRRKFWTRLTPDKGKLGHAILACKNKSHPLPFQAEVAETVLHTQHEEGDHSGVSVLCAAITLSASGLADGSVDDRYHLKELASNVLIVMWRRKSTSRWYRKGRATRKKAPIQPLFFDPSLHSAGWPETFFALRRKPPKGEATRRVRLPYRLRLATLPDLDAL